MRQNQIFFKGVFCRSQRFLQQVLLRHNEKPSPPEGSEGLIHLQAFPLNERNYLLKCTEEVRPLASYSGVTL